MTQTEAPIETKSPTRPRLDVPIMLNITKEDLNQAAPFMDCENCLIATALKRRGYVDLAVGGGGVDFYNESREKIVAQYQSDQISCKDLTILGRWYKKSVVGRQIILYPLWFRE